MERPQLNTVLVRSLLPCLGVRSTGLQLRFAGRRRRDEGNGNTPTHTTARVDTLIRDKQFVYPCCDVISCPSSP